MRTSGRIAVARPAWIPTSVAGTENIAPADTRDADYAELLQKANVKGVASPSGMREGRREPTKVASPLGVREGRREPPVALQPTTVVTGVAA